MGHALVVDVQSGIGHHVGHERTEGLGRQEVQLEVLCPTADCLDDLVWLGGGKHEDDMIGWFLKRLEQGVFGTRCEHVHLVKEVDLGPTWCPERHLAQQVTHVVDLVV